MANRWDEYIRAKSPAARRDKLVREVCDYLDGAVFKAEHRASISTHELVEAIYPEHEAFGDAIRRRQILFDDLAAASVQSLLWEYWDYGPEKVRFGRAIRPLRWHAKRASVAPVGKPTAPPRYALYGLLNGSVSTEAEPEGAWVKWEDVREFFA